MVCGIEIKGSEAIFTILKKRNGNIQDITGKFRKLELENDENLHSSIMSLIDPIYRNDVYVFTRRKNRTLRPSYLFTKEFSKRFTNDYHDIFLYIYTKKNVAKRVSQQKQLKREKSYVIGKVKETEEVIGPKLLFVKHVDQERKIHS